MGMRKKSKATNSPHFLTVVELLARRRQIQRQMLCDGLVEFDLASPVADDHRKLRRLSQNIGYIADALESGEEAKNLDTKTMLWDGVLTLTSNGFAWLEALAEPAGGKEKKS